MNKTELIAQIANEHKISKITVSKIVNAFTDSVKQTLKSGDSVTLVGFGTFSVGVRAARKGRNPKTGAEIDIAESKSPKFKPGKELKDIFID